MLRILIVAIDVSEKGLSICSVTFHTMRMLWIINHVRLFERLESVHLLALFELVGETRRRCTPRTVLTSVLLPIEQWERCIETAL